MRKITKLAISHFLEGVYFNQSNTEVIPNFKGISLYLHGNEIATKSPEGTIKVTTAGWPTNTTKERLNGIPGVKVTTVKGQLYLNGEEWDGGWAIC